VLLDRKRVKFWQKWVFLFMAILMALFLIVGYSGVLQGCNKNSGTPGGSIGDTINADKARLQAQPRDPAILTLLGVDYTSAAAGEPQGSTAETDDWSRAVGYYEQAYAVYAKQKGAPARQNAIATLNKIAPLYIQLKDYKNVVITYQRLVTYQPRNADNYFYLGLYALQAGDTKTALSALERNLKLDPNSANASAISAQIKQLKAATVSPVPTPSPSPTPTPTKSGAK
jgi:tetratricopeptide (TPR) repeat protein